MADSLFTVITSGVLIALGAFLAVLVADYFFVESPVPESPVPERLAPAPIDWPRRLGNLVAWVIAIGLVVAVVLGYIWSSVIWAPAPTPLQAFGPATGGGPLYVGTDSSGEVRYAMISNGVAEYTFNLENTSESAITITGLAERGAMDLAASGGLFPAGVVASHVGDAVMSTAPFAIEAHSSLTVTLIVRLVTCSAFGNVPTLGPGISPSASMAAQLWMNFRNEFGTSSLRITYQGPGGKASSAPIGLPAGLDLVGNDATACENLTPAPTR
jgi:hypothetical protein